MLVVRVYLRPGGDRLAERQIGEMRIGRREMLKEIGKDNLASYNVALSSNDKGRAFNPKKIWRTGLVSGFNRTRWGKWDLIYLALHETIGARHVKKNRRNTRIDRLRRQQSVEPTQQEDL